MNASEVRQENPRKSFTLVHGSPICFQAELLKAKVPLAPIHRLPHELLSTIPDYYFPEEVSHSTYPTIQYFVDSVDRYLITLTHVCRYWRDVFTSRSSLWSRFYITNVDKTRAYIQRSRTSPLEIYAYEAVEEALAPLIPHVHRLKSLIICGRILPRRLGPFCGNTPLLQKLSIIAMGPIETDYIPGPFETELSEKDLSSLYELTLEGVTTTLPWRNLTNLRVVNLVNYFPEEQTVTQLLDFFESVPLLHTVQIQGPIQGFSETPERLVPLPNLKEFYSSGPEPHLILLRQLHIPVGASLFMMLRFQDVNEELPLLECLPDRSPNFSNISRITSANLFLGDKFKYIQFSGPSGALRIGVSMWDRGLPSYYSVDRQILHSLSNQTSATQRVTVKGYRHLGSDKIEKCLIFQTLFPPNDIRTLVLIDCSNRHFIRALDPEEIPSNVVLCDKLEDLVIYIRWSSLLNLEQLDRMVKNRALRGAEISSVTLVRMCPEDPQMEENATRLGYRLHCAPIPEWDDN